MATMTAETDSRPTSWTATRIRVGGTWLAIGALLSLIGLALHPPPSPDPAVFMATIAAEPTRWVAAHATTAIGLSAFTIAGLFVLTAESRLTETWWTTTAWGALIVSALWVTTTAVTEATVITRAAVAGDTATFEAWSAFGEAHSLAFLAFLLAVALIAGNEARSAHRTTPVWASWVGAVAGVVAFVGMLLVFVFGVALGGPVWLGSTMVTSAWLLWFGARLARTDDAAWTPTEEPDPGRGRTVR